MAIGFEVENGSGESKDEVVRYFDSEKSLKLPCKEPSPTSGAFLRIPAMTDAQRSAMGTPACYGQKNSRTWFVATAGYEHPKHLYSIYSVLEPLFLRHVAGHIKDIVTWSIS